MNELVVRNEMDIMTLGDVLAQSGYFQDSKQAAQAIVKVIAGQELGFGPVASMTGIHIIQGKVALGANLLAAAIKRSGRYNYHVLDHTNDGCKIEFFENGKSVGISEFNKADATAAGLLGKDNWKKFPRNMYFSRALSNGQKWYCPDVGNGAPLYTPDELGASVDEDNNIIDIPVEVVGQQAQPPAPKQPAKDKPYKFPSNAAQKFFDDCQKQTGNHWQNGWHFVRSMDNAGLKWDFLNDDDAKAKAFAALTDGAMADKQAKDAADSILGK